MIVHHSGIAQGIVVMPGNLSLCRASSSALTAALRYQSPVMCAVNHHSSGSIIKILLNECAYSFSITQLPPENREAGTKG